MIFRLKLFFIFIHLVIYLFIFYPRCEFLDLSVQSHGTSWTHYGHKSNLKCIWVYINTLFIATSGFPPVIGCSSVPSLLLSNIHNEHQMWTIPDPNALKSLPYLPLSPTHTLTPDRLSVRGPAKCVSHQRTRTFCVFGGFFSPKQFEIWIFCLSSASP